MSHAINKHDVTPEQVLALVQQSPAFVLAHDRTGWLGLFGAAGYIEDPVGTPAARVNDGSLARFWDTFIGPNEVEFEVHRDYQVGRAVFRDAVVHTCIAGSLKLDVPAYLLYEVAESGQTIARMTAHWPLSSLSLGALKMGPSAWIEMTKLFVRMIRRMGLKWVGGYLAALWNGVGARGPRVLAQLCRAIAERDASGIVSSFVDARASVQLRAAEASALTLLELLPAGSRLTIADPVAAGWRTAFRFVLESDSGRAAGLGLAEFAPETARILRLQFFPG